jgi:hypothetical protein
MCRAQAHLGGRHHQVVTQALAQRDLRGQSLGRRARVVRKLDDVVEPRLPALVHLRGDHEARDRQLHQVACVDGVAGQEAVEVADGEVERGGVLHLEGVVHLHEPVDRVRAQLLGHATALLLHLQVYRARPMPRLHSSEPWHAARCWTSLRTRFLLYTCHGYIPLVRLQFVSRSW